MEEQGIVTQTGEGKKAWLRWNQWERSEIEHYGAELNKIVLRKDSY
jgi:hypothetical protein